MKTFTHFKLILKTALCSLLATLIVVSPVSAKPDEATLDFFDLNDIPYYDPTGADPTGLFGFNCIGSNNTTGSGITIIGDSITASAKSAISELLPDAQIYAQYSKQFGSLGDEPKAPDSEPDSNKGGPSGFSIVKYLLDQGTLGSTVVYALGTNNSGLTTTQVNDLLELLQNRTIFFISNYKLEAGNKNTTYTNNNSKLAAAAQNSNVSVIPWADEAAKDPDAYISTSDGLNVHPTEEGKQLFAKLIDQYVGGTTSVTAGPNGSYTNYAGDRIFTDHQIEQLERSIPLYQKAIEETNASQYGITWQILATIHYKETALGWANPKNGQGIFQLASYVSSHPGAFPHTGQALSESEVVEQAKLALEVAIIPRAQNLDLSTDGGVKKLFYGYNGINSYYKQKALNMGFSETQANNGEGSPYVMNKYDAARDPSREATMDPNWRGLFVRDGVYNSGAVSQTFGAYTVYVALGGSNGSTPGVPGDLCIGGTYVDSNGNIVTAGGGISSGGLTFEQAKAFMNDYTSHPEYCSTYGLYCSHGSSGGPLANCVTFVQYFIKRFTSATIGNLGHGGWVVSSLTGQTVHVGKYTYRSNVNYSSQGFTYGGFEPRPFAIFSNTESTVYDNGVPCGHTGVVLGIDQANNKIYIGQTGYGTSLNSPFVTTIAYDLDKYTNGKHWYAYTDGIVNAAALSQAIGGN